MFSKIVISEKERRRRRIIYAALAVLLSFMFIYGYVTVYVNSYNIMNREPMVVFEFQRENGGFSLTVLNKKIGLFQNKA